MITMVLNLICFANTTKWHRTSLPLKLYHVIQQVNVILRCIPVHLLAGFNYLHLLSELWSEHSRRSAKWNSTSHCCHGGAHGGSKVPHC